MVMKDLGMRAVATRDIEIGEEISISCEYSYLSSRPATSSSS